MSADRQMKSKEFTYKNVWYNRILREFLSEKADGMPIC